MARQCITRCQFLGGHPLAGKERRGAAAADGDLFRNRAWVLTPDAPEELNTGAARSLRGWLERMGARLVVLDADEHDRVVALHFASERNWHPRHWQPRWRTIWARRRICRWPVPAWKI